MVVYEPPGRPARLHGTRPEVPGKAAGGTHPLRRHQDPTSEARDNLITLSCHKAFSLVNYETFYTHIYQMEHWFLPN